MREPVFRRSVTAAGPTFLSFTHTKWTVMVGEWLARIERETGLKIIAVDTKNDVVVYGNEHLKSVMDDEAKE